MPLQELADALRDAVSRAPDNAKVATVILFGIKHAAELHDVPPAKVVKAAGFDPAWASEVRKGRKLAEFVKLK